MTATTDTGKARGATTPLAVFVLPIEPVPASRPRVTKWGTYIAKPYKQWLDAAGKVLKGARAFPLPEAHLVVHVEIVCTKARTSKLTTPKGDIDNYVKAPLDAITHAKLWADDKWVTRLSAVKRFAEGSEVAHTRVEVSLERPACA